MKTYKQVQTATLRVTEIICNKCGKIIPVDLGALQVRPENFSIVWGYGSKNDFETWEFDLCEDCILELTASFKHTPKIYPSIFVI